MLFLFREHILSTAAASPSGASIILGEHVSGTSRSTHSLKTPLCFCVEEKIIANNNNSGGFKLSPSPYSEDYRVIARWCHSLLDHVLCRRCMFSWEHFVIPVWEASLFSSTLLYYYSVNWSKKKEKKKGIIYMRTPDRSWGTAVKTYD